MDNSPIRDYPDATERAVQYSPSSVVEDLEPLLARYRSESRQVLEGHSPVRHAWYDIFPTDGSTLHCFVHGGYWQELDRQDAHFPAPGFLERGVAYAALGYPLAPSASIEEMIEILTECVSELVGTHDRLILSGSSAGAHLAAMVAHRVPVDGLVLLSGIYDLRPLVGTYVNDALEMDGARAAALSPLLMEPLEVPTVVAYGELETSAFKDQSRALARHWSVVDPLEVAGRNHFDVLHDLSDLATAVGSRVAELEV